MHDHSCCTPGGSKGGYSVYALWLPRIAFGLILVGYGLNHLRFLADFTGFAGSVFTIPALSTLASLLAYAVPFLMIIGGALFAINQLCHVSKICILAALGGIIGWASLAVMLGDGQMGPTMMPFITNTAIIFILYHVIKKMWKKGCGSGCACGAGCNCGCAGCDCSPSAKHM